MEAEAYKNDDVEKWNNNYHTKVEFFFVECESRGVVRRVRNSTTRLYGSTKRATMDSIMWVGATVPDQRVLRRCTVSRPGGVLGSVR